MIFRFGCKAKRLRPLRLVFFLIGIFAGPLAGKADLKIDMLLEGIQLPPGFTIEVFSDQVPGARSLTISPSGIVYAGTRQNGCVYAVIDENGDHLADRVITLARDLTMPNGVDFDQGDLYVAEVDRILRFAAVEARLDNPGQPEVIYDRLPKDLEHGWKTIAFGPDGMLYLSIGAPCDACLSENPVYATIARLNRDGSDFEVFVRGVRNSMGFDWHPRTAELWFTDNGRDWMGDDLPPDELNHAPLQGLHFGFPFCHGAAIVDPQLGREGSCPDYTPPAGVLGAHVAPLGMRFYTGSMFPPSYQGHIFFAEHGSWNRSRKSGYQLSLARLHNNQVTAIEPFARGWLLGNSAWGRPVDLVVMADGSLLVSDDQNGVIYRIAYQADSTAATNRPSPMPTNPSQQ